MRLTLRTLLAYLDDILDPADKEELAKKIESSEFAEDLIHRTRDTTRRLRLSAPQVVGSGMGLDPNTVAEYLDNVLPPDQVGDFERICLESDMHLAEVASAHHVLTMVLGEPADVEPAARQRMYAIPAAITPATAAPVQGGAPLPAATPVAPSLATATITGADAHSQPAADGRPRAVEIPDYLRTAGWSRYRGILLGLAALLLVSVTVFMLGGAQGWFGGTSPTPVVAQSDGGGPAAPPSEDMAAADGENASSDVLGAGDVGGDSSTPGGISDSPPALLAPGMAGPSGADVTPPESPYSVVDDRTADTNTGGRYDLPPAEVTPGAGKQGLAVSSEPAAESTDSDRAAPMYGLPDAVDGDPASADSTTAAASAIQPPDQPPSPYDVRPASEPAPPFPALPGESLSTAGTVPIMSATPDQSMSGLNGADPSMSGGEPRIASLPTDVAIEGSPDAAAAMDPPGDITETEVEQPAELPADLGTYLGGKTVLLRWDESLGTWLRMAPRGIVVAGQELLSLPAFRPKVTLTSGVHMDISGGTRVHIDTAGAIDAGDLPPIDPNMAAINVVYGRIVLINTANDDKRVRLVLGPSVSDTTIARNAIVAVEVLRDYVPGHDPRQSPAPISVKVFAPEGGVVWRDSQGEMEIENASQWTIVAGERSVASRASSLPEWIDQEPVTQRSEFLYGAPVVEGSLDYSRPIDNQLLEIFQGGRRREVKSLVARSSIHAGMFVPFVEALRDSGQRANWKSHIDTLRAAMALSPDSANRLWRTLVEQRGEGAATDLYEMLCGYNTEQVGQTPEEIKSGALERLIAWLENDSLDYRVLAWHNLSEVTGKTLLQNPAGNSAERSMGVRRWRSRLEEGDLQPVADPPSEP